MCEYSLLTAKSRSAKKGDKLVSKTIGHSVGFVDQKDRETAVCLLPGTEVAFGGIEVKYRSKDGGIMANKPTATFAEVPVENSISSEPGSHYDALRFPDGTIVKLRQLLADQEASVASLPAQPGGGTGGEKHESRHEAVRELEHA